MPTSIGRRRASVERGWSRQQVPPYGAVTFTVSGSV